MAIGAKAIWEFADALKQSFSTPDNMRSATVQSVDDDGTVWVVYPGASSPTPVASIGAGVEPGDMVYTQLLNGKLVLTLNKTDPAIGGTKTRAIVNAITKPIDRAVVIAKGIADEAHAVANAINQHFWTDDNGAHVTDVTQDEWKAAVEDGFSDLSDTKPYYNQLSNSLGILLRSGLNNLASWTRSAIAFYDGEGNEAANIVASFGRDGAQIGHVDSEHVDIGSGRVSMLNADGVPMFNADLDGGVVSYEAKLRSDNRVTKLPSNVGATNTTSWWTMSFNVQNVAAGTTFTLATNPNGYTNLLNIEYSGTDSAIYFDVSNATYSQGLRLGTRNNHLTLLVDISADALSLVAGTSETGTLEASGIAWSTTSGTPNTLSVRFSYTYNADTGTLQCTTRYSIRTATGTATIASRYSEVTFWGLAILVQIATYAPAFTLGARTGDNGQFSAIVGEGLYATQDHQTALGKYNLEDTNDEYALIIGNGTDDANRSNAFAVDWDGGILAAKPLFKRVTATSAAQTINAGAGLNFTITVNVPDGYTLFGVIGQSSNHNLAGTIGTARVTGASTVSTSLTNRTASTNWTDATVTVDTVCILSTVV